ncbi:MAG: general secretion pathway protein GspG [Betaproteobacteria bacterium]|nr:general secretion pathway protein GspG [Betaproteobacteria bacterium]
MMITVAMIGILATMIVPVGELVARRAKEQQLHEALRQIRYAIDGYKKAVDDGRIEKKADASGYPPSLRILVQGVPDVKSPDHRIIYFLRRVPRDPFSPRNLDAADTWGKRSYESPPDAPAEGDDVFDVYSRADGIGLNGVPYGQW